MVITASLSLADIPGTVRLWRQRKAEYLLSVAAFFGVVLLGVLPGIAIAVGLSILNFFRRAWRPYDTRLGRVEGLAGHHDVRSYPPARQLPGLVIYRFDGPLFFANATTFRDEIRRMARADPPPRWILVAAEPITDVDTTADRTLRPDPHHQPPPLLPHHRIRHRRLPPRNRRAARHSRITTIRLEGRTHIRNERHRSATRFPGGRLIRCRARSSREG